MSDLKNHEIEFTPPPTNKQDQILTLSRASLIMYARQPVQCPNWILGVGDCKKPDCPFCKIQICMDILDETIATMWKEVEKGE